MRRSSCSRPRSCRNSRRARQSANARKQRELAPFIEAALARKVKMPAAARFRDPGVSGARSAHYRRGEGPERRSTRNRPRVDCRTGRLVGVPLVAVESRRCEHRVEVVHAALASRPRLPAGRATGQCVVRSRSADSGSTSFRTWPDRRVSFRAPSDAVLIDSMRCLEALHRGSKGLCLTPMFGRRLAALAAVGSASRCDRRDSLADALGVLFEIIRIRIDAAARRPARTRRRSAQADRDRATRSPSRPSYSCSATVSA